MQSPAELIKRAPRWSLYVGGGVVVGGFALRMYRNRTTSDGSSPDANTTPGAQTVGGGPAYGVSSAAPGVIVPPVIIDSGAADQSGTGLGALQDTYFGGISALLGTFTDITGGLFGQSAQVIDAQTGILNTSVGTLSTIALNAGAGAAPQPVAINPTPVVAAVPTPTAAPIVAPRPAAPVNPCAGTGYPFQGPHGCYKVGCKGGKRAHLYKNGQDMIVSGKCP